MNFKEGIGSKIFDVCNYIFLSLFTLTIIYPFVYMFSVSISSPQAVGLMKVRLLPIDIQWNSYLTVFHDPQILQAYYNSILFTVVGTIIVLFVNGLAAYSLTKAEFRAKNFFVIVFSITMFFSGGMIPAYLNIKNLGLLDTMWAIIFPAVGMWNIVMLRTNFQTIPSSLIEAAYIDGANDWYIFFKIVVPLSKAIFATIAVFAAVGYWNNYFGPLLYLTSPSKEPLTILLRRILVSGEALQSSASAASAASSEQRYDDPAVYQGMIESLKMATVFVTIGPIILVYPFLQKYFVKGVMIGSVKG